MKKYICSAGGFAEWRGEPIGASEKLVVLAEDCDPRCFDGCYLQRGRANKGLETSDAPVSSNQRVPTRYRIQQDKGEYCLKGCEDGDLVDWSEYDAQRRRGDVLNAELSGFMKAATKREAAQSAEIERLRAALEALLADLKLRHGHVLPVSNSALALAEKALEAAPPAETKAARP